MRIFEVMSSRALIVPSTLSAAEAWHQMTAHSERHAIVKDGSHVVGVLSDADAGGRHGAALRAGKTVAQLMDPHFASVTRQDTLRRAANLMRGHSTGCLPVIENGRLLGVVTIAHLLGVLGHGVERPNHEARAALHHRVAHRKAATSSGRW